MPLYRTQVELAMTSGIPEDKATNVWWFLADDLSNLDLALTQLTTFYGAIDGELSGRVATTGHRVRCYDMDDPEPRAPVKDQGLGTLTPSSTSLPTEVAMCISYQAARSSGVSQARRRGRLYIGPLKKTAVEDTGLPQAAMITVLQGAIQNLLDAAQAATTWDWVVYSPTDGLAVSVHDGWIDNAFDIQRRRGLTATSRVLFS